MGSVVIRDNYKSLSGAEKAAIMFLTIGEDRAAPLMERLEDDEIRLVSRAMAGLGTITANLLEELIQHFTERFAKGGSIVGSYDSAERMLKSFLPPDRVSEIMTYIRGPAGRTTWEKMSNVNESLLAKYLIGEHPQTIAVVLSKIVPDHAAKVMPLLPAETVNDVLRRMIKLQSVQQEALSDIEDMLHRELMTNYALTHGPETHEQLAEIFNRTEADYLDTVLSQLEQDLPDAVDQIRQLMFTFDDLLDLDPVSLGIVVRSCDSEVLVFALKGCPEEIRNTFISHLSERAGSILRDSIDSTGPVLTRDVEAAKAAIVRKAKELAEVGQIIIQRGNEQEAVIY